MNGLDIKIARQRAGLKQYELANRVEISQSIMSMIETNRYEPSQRLLTRIMREINVYKQETCNSKRLSLKTAVPTTTSIDVLKEYLEEECTIGEEEKVEPKALYSAYKIWCIIEGYEFLDSREFPRHLKGLGYVQVKRGSSRYWLGLSVKNSGTRSAKRKKRLG